MYASETAVYRSASEINSAMSRVYGHMGLALITSLIVSLFVGTTPVLLEFFFTGFMKWITIFAPLVAVFAISFALAKDPPKEIAMLLLHGFAAVMGLSLAAIFAVFKMGSIVGAFMGAAVLFGTMTFYGYFTKQNLDNWGKWLFVGLIAVVIASVINVFIGSSVGQMVISTLAIIIFTGLTAYDTQKIREEVSVENNGVAEIRGALSLYLNFINIFISLLQLFGNKDE